MNTRVIIKKTDGTCAEETDILSFSFVKDAYIPYTSLSARLYARDGDCLGAAEILFYIDDILIHHGLIDSLEKAVYDGRAIITLASRGFTSLLAQNQLEPGMISDISINSLMDSFYTLPYITHEDNSDSSNYIFVKNGSSMWDGIVNLSYKLCGTYPYIRGTNCVRITHEANPNAFTYDSKSIISQGIGYNFRRRISHFHMADLEGAYGSFEYSDTSAAESHIIRHKFFELDRQFLYSPEEALVYHDKLANRGYMRYFCEYCGYRGEDLFDIASFDAASARPVTSVEISGSCKGIFTRIGSYTDNFLS